MVASGYVPPHDARISCCIGFPSVLRGIIGQRDMALQRCVDKCRGISMAFLWHFVDNNLSFQMFTKYPLVGGNVAQVGIHLTR